MKFIEQLKEKCKKILGKSFVENYGILLICAGFYNVNWVYTCSVLVVQFLYVYFEAATAHYCFFVRADSALLAESMYFTVGLFFCFLLQLSFVASRRRFDEFLRALDQGIYDYGDTIDPSTQKELDSLNEKYAKQKRFYTSNLCKTYFTTGYLNLIVFPIISGRFSLEEDDEYITRRSLMMKVTPFYTKSGLGWYINLILDIFCVATVVFVHNSIQIPFISFAQDGCKELAVVACTMKNVFVRAKYVFKRKYGREADSYQSREFQQCLSECMADTVKHHIATVSCYKKFTKAFSMLVFTVFLSGASLLCTSALVLISKSTDMTMKAIYLTFVPEEMFETFIFAYYGERLAQLSFALYEEVYFTGWEEASQVMLPYLNIIQEYTRTSKISVSGLGYINYNYNLFGNIMSSAYSYLNVMSASGNF